MPNNLLWAAIQDFKPAPSRPVVVWFHQASGDEHYVGFAEETHLAFEDLKIRFEWLIRVEHIKNAHEPDEPEWRPIAHSKKSRNLMAFTGVKLKAAHDDQIELQDGRDKLNLYTGPDRIKEAQGILSCY